MTADRTVTHLEGTQKSRAFSPAVVTQGGKIVWLAGQTALTDLDGKSIAHDFEAYGLNQRSGCGVFGRRETLAFFSWRNSHRAFR
jgi:hypothetical protein